MAIPASREEFKNYCLRRLGAPVVDINVDEEQIQDRIDDALLYYRDYHFDGTEKIYLKYEVTPTDITNRYLTLPENMIGVTRVFDIGDGRSASNLFNVRYQIRLNDMFNIASSDMVPYVSAMRNIEMMQEIFVGKKPIRFNRHVNKLHVDMDWSVDIQPSEYIIVEGYSVLDPNVYTDVWGDRWLHRYSTALIKRQWGENLKKFEGMQMPGGLTFSGQKIWEESIEEIRLLEDEMLNSYSLPVTDLVG